VVVDTFQQVDVIYDAHGVQELIWVNESS